MSEFMQFTICLALGEWIILGWVIAAWLGKNW